MRMMGGKHAIAERIASILQRRRKFGQLYVEPFIGAASVFIRMEPPRIAYDKNPWLIIVWNALRDGWIPPDQLEKDQWLELRKTKPMKPITAFAGFCCAWGGDWFSSYAFSKKGINFAETGQRSCLKKAAMLLPSDRFLMADYRALNPEDSLIYADPPYGGRKPRHGVGKFDSQEFWTIVKTWASRNNQVVISEGQAPPGFVCVAEFEQRVSKGCTARIIEKSGRTDVHERLFMPVTRITHG